MHAWSPQSDPSMQAVVRQKGRMEAHTVPSAQAFQPTPQKAAEHRPSVQLLSAGQSVSTTQLSGRQTANGRSPSTREVQLEPAVHAPSVQACGIALQRF